MDDTPNEAAEAAETDSSSQPIQPTLLFESVTFSDGTTLDLGEDDIVVLVGPNNSGKSAALRELEEFIARSIPKVVIKSAKIKKIGDSNDLRTFLERNAQKSGEPNNLTYGGIGYNIHQTTVGYFDNDADRHPVAPFFAKRLATETRIQDSNPAQSIPLFQAPPSHPIHMLLMDENLAADISSKFRGAFGEDLTAFRAGGGQFPLYVGDKPPLKPGKDELSQEFIEELQRTNVLLSSQGDGMRSFATVLLNVLASKTHTLRFLDEPEAFLHPPQARLLGRYIAETRREKSQLFIATHSTDILDGLLEGGTGNVRIVRLRRDGIVNRVKELGNEQTKSIAKDTLIRFSRVFEGIFFEHVVVCESDADCMFYQSILDLPSISGERKPDVLFVHTAGKHRMAKLASTLRALDVPVSVIADIDILSEKNIFKQLFESLGGSWSAAEPHWKVISRSVVSQRPPMNATQVAGMIKDEISTVTGTGEFPLETTAAIKRIFKTLSPWSTLKQGGRAALPSGDPTNQFNQLYEKCAAVGLWIVPVGEIEGFCRSIGLHGPGFVEKVLEERNLETDDELKEAREFVGQLWRRAHRN